VFQPLLVDDYWGIILQLTTGGFLKYSYKHCFCTLSLIDNRLIVGNNLGFLGPTSPGLEPDLTAAAFRAEVSAPEAPGWGDGYGNGNWGYDIFWGCDIIVG